MEAPQLQPDLLPPSKLRLLEGTRAAPDSSGVSLGAWIVLFGALSFSGGHGLFLLTALTRLQTLPSKAELGGTLESAAIAWFVAATPLAFACAALRRRFLQLSSAAAWSVSSGVLAVTLGAFAFYLHAVALA